MFRFVTLFLAISVFSSNAQASLPAYCNLTFNDGGGTFVNSANEAKKALDSLCLATQGTGISADELQTTFLSFHRALFTEANAAIPSLIPYLGSFNQPLFKFDSTINNQIETVTATGLAPRFTVDRPDPISIDGFSFIVQGRGQPIITIVPKAIAEPCFNDLQCRQAINNYMKILGQVYNPLAAATLALTHDFLSIKDKQWTSFIEEARSQTFVDIALTSALYEWRFGKQPNVFSSPPKVQWFALHPSVIIENVNGAIDGDETKESLALEVIGFNYWQDACFGFACGASLIINYADRNGIDDTGWGFMFHVDNSYSFGVTKHGGAEGFFITVDLLKLFQDKKSSFSDYKNKFRKLAL